MSDPTPSTILPLLTAKHLHPTPAWLQTFLATQRPTTPLPALASTASFRLLASDITQTLSSPPHSVLPADIQDVSVKERRLGPGGTNTSASSMTTGILVQVLDIEDIGRSRWSQVEELEALERGEGTRGREIVRVEVPEVTGDSSGTAGGAGNSASTGTAGGAGAGARGSAGPHKLLLQDVKGKVVYGVEVTSVKGIELGMGIGGKILLKGCTAARGMVLLEPETVVVLGGKIEGLHAEWVKGRKDRLKERLDAEDEA